MCTCKDSIRQLKSVKAVQLESVLQVADRNGGIEQAFQAQVSLQLATIKCTMQCLCWLVKLEIPHTNYYNSLIEIRNSLDVMSSSTYTVVKMLSILAKELFRNF